MSDWPSVWTGPPCTLHVHLSAIKLVRGVELQSIDYKHKYFAAKTGIVGTDLDRMQRGRTFKTFSMYRYIFYLLI